MQSPHGPAAPNHDPLSAPVESHERHPQSGMGIASCVIGATATLSVIMMMVVVRAMVASDLTPADELSPIFYVVGGWIFGTGVLSLAGIVFGIGGLRQRQRRYQCATIGLIANIVIPICLMAYLVIKATFQRSIWEKQAPVEVDPDGWHSPLTLFLALTFIFIAVFFVARLLHNRRPPAQSVATNPCPKCRKLLPPASQFCRRCGHSLRSEPPVVVSR